MNFIKKISIFGCLLIIAPHALDAPPKQNMKGNAKEITKQAKQKSNAHNDSDDELLNSRINDPELVKARNQLELKANHRRIMDSSHKLSPEQKKENESLNNILNLIMLKKNQDEQDSIDKAKEIIGRIKNKHVIDYQTIDGKTVLMRAVIIGNVEICKLLLEKNANCNLLDMQGLTALIHVIEQNQGNHKEEIIDLLIAHGANINITNNAGSTPLMLAVERNEELITKKFLQKNADPDFKNNKKDTALILAIINGNEPIIKLLLDHNADPDIANNLGQTALMLAVQKNNGAMVKKILQKKANPNLEDHQKNTALMFAVFGNNLSITDQLLKHKANPNILNRAGFSALMIASANNNPAIVKALLKHEALLNLKEKANDLTALMLATEEGNEMIAKILLEAGADPLSKNNNELNALKIAKEKDHKNIVQAIRENVSNKLEQKNKIIDLRKSYKSLHNYANNRQKNAFMDAEKQVRTALIEEEKTLREAENTILNENLIERPYDWNAYWTEEDEKRLLNRDNPFKK